ncbi:MAG TPA: DUF3024 domain-containing protein [Syntrophales bacterium]|nr:DUF3024 domain-containing protein [Syntrophales bacterium]HOX94346.1 DUF3024 domain-containing protein [Syntrophales bacterium]HPI57091.1 DUF3024 domain-containing protein [Syntrophales bacterium]HPN24822.1 DUF3024 domain-containing protein [Syntrophales bacterium]HQM30109.1 DUF3024 domain-containing protein [Syntrophales bacterium]
MALSEFTRKLVETKLSWFCREKIPLHYRTRIRLGFRIESDFVTIFEQRPRFADPCQWVDLDVAQFRWNERTKTWSLYYRDREADWRAYYLKPKVDFEILFREVDEDPVEVFGGF